MSAERTCPVCDATFSASEAPHSPFCSARCKNVDLNRWLSGGYTIAGNATGDDSEGIDDLHPSLPSEDDDSQTRH